jgi:hypothetical protein
MVVSRECCAPASTVNYPRTWVDRSHRPAVVGSPSRPGASGRSFNSRGTPPQSLTPIELSVVRNGQNKLPLGVRSIRIKT